MAIAKATIDSIYFSTVTSSLKTPHEIVKLDINKEGFLEVIVCNKLRQLKVLLVPKQYYNIER
jgi:hypothetical protein